jgi:predicted nucleic acid-binding protein
VFDGKPLKILMTITEECILALSDYIVEELKRNIQNKLDPIHSEKILKELNILISGCEVKTSSEYQHYICEAIRMISRKDSPVLACGMLPDIDFILTSDKEFWKINDNRVKVITPEDANFFIP